MEGGKNGDNYNIPIAFLKKHRDNYSMVVKYSAGLKTLLQYGNLGPVFNEALAFASSEV